MTTRTTATLPDAEPAPGVVLPFPRGRHRGYCGTKANRMLRMTPPGARRWLRSEVLDVHAAILRRLGVAEVRIGAEVRALEAAIYRDLDRMLDPPNPGDQRCRK